MTEQRRAGNGHLHEGHELEWDVLAEAEITDIEFAKLVNVSRPSVCLWRNGHNNPHYLRVPELRRALAAIKAALDAKELPRPHEGTADQRFKRLDKVLDKYVTYH